MKDLVSFVVFIDDDQKSDVPNDLKELGLRIVFFLNLQFCTVPRCSKFQLMALPLLVNIFPDLIT